MRRSEFQLLWHCDPKPQPSFKWPRVTLPCRERSTITLGDHQPLGAGATRPRDVFYSKNPLQVYSLGRGSLTFHSGTACFFAVLEEQSHWIQPLTFFLPQLVGKPAPIPREGSTWAGSTAANVREAFQGSALQGRTHRTNAACLWPEEVPQAWVYSGFAQMVKDICGSAKWCEVELNKWSNQNMGQTGRGIFSEQFQVTINV